MDFILNHVESYYSYNQLEQILEKYAGALLRMKDCVTYRVGIINDSIFYGIKLWVLFPSISLFF